MKAETTTPKVSIIVPVYNVEQYLRDCLDSILNQTFTEWECIIVDDGSKDGSSIICEEYAGRYDRFMVVHKENEGVSAARNTGLEMAKGFFVTFVDADDILLPEALYVLYQAQVTSGSDIVCADAWQWNGEKKIC